MESSSLREMNERRTAWLNEKPQGDWGSQLSYQEGDVIIFNFVSTGSDGDTFIKLWRAHEFDALSRNGRPMAVHRYCYTQNGETDKECVYCTQGQAVLKERMSMWLWVDSIMHTTMPPEKAYPQVQYQGRLYFHEEVKAFRIWHASAWRDSPWNDILTISEIYKGLHGFTAQMSVVGRELQRRYKIIALPNSPQTTAETYEQAKAECQPIPAILKEQLAQPVAVNPNAAAAAQQPSVLAGATPGAVPFVLGGTAAAPTYHMGGSTAAPTAAAAATTAPAPEQAAAPVAETTAAAPEQPADFKRPLKELF